MNFLLKIKPKYRLPLGLFLVLTGGLALYVNLNFETDFLGGFITGLIFALAFLLIVTNKKNSIP
jgi:uncharacterized membrane protein (UPF0136 family)